jgi:hypothetical protein
MIRENTRPGGQPGRAKEDAGCVTTYTHHTTNTAELQPLGLARRGWAIFPVRCIPPTKAEPDGVKQPLVPWTKESTADPTKAARLFAEHPSYNAAGVDCGKSGLVVVDLDRKNGVDGLASWRDLVQQHEIDARGALVDLTPTGGRHLYFTDPTGGAIHNSTGKLAPGVDVRGAGGFVVAPGSLHPNGGRYVAIGDWSHAPAPLPAALVDLLTPPPAPVTPVTLTPSGNGHEPVTLRNATRYTEAAVNAELSILRAAPEGKRNDALNRAAFVLGTLAGASWSGLAAAEVEPMLTAAGGALGLTAREVPATVKSGLSAGLAEPRREPKAGTRPMAAPSIPWWSPPMGLQPAEPDLFDPTAAMKERMALCGTVCRHVRPGGRPVITHLRCGYHSVCPWCGSIKAADLRARVAAALEESGALFCGMMRDGQSRALVRKLGRASILRIPQSRGMAVVFAPVAFPGSLAVDASHVSDAPEAIGWWAALVHNIPSRRRTSGKLGEEDTPEAAAVKGKIAHEPRVLVTILATDGTREQEDAAWDRAAERLPDLVGDDLEAMQHWMDAATAGFIGELLHGGLAITFKMRKRKRLCDLIRKGVGLTSYGLSHIGDTTGLTASGHAAGAGPG